MKALLILPSLPYPPDSGGKVRMFNLIKNLSHEHKMSLLCYMKPGDDAQYIPYLLKYCEDVRVVHRRSIRSIQNFFLAMFSKYPFLVVMRGFSHGTEKKILEIVRMKKPDLIHVETFYVSQPILKIKNYFKIPLLLAKHNIESLVYERYFRTRKNPFLRLLGYLDTCKMKKYEIEVCKHFDSFTLVSENDLRTFKKLIPGLNSNSYVIPNGVDLSYFDGKVDHGIENKQPTLLFVGTFAFVGNIDALLYFYRYSFPIIQRKIPNVKLYIVGSRPPKRIERLSSDSVVVTGYVEDLREYLTMCDVFIVPLRAGSGTRLKILEAMAMRKPVVSTSIGTEGIGAVPGRDIIIADTPEEFAEEVIKLLKNKKLRARIGSNGRKLVETKYNWEPIAKKLSQVYQETVEKFALKRKKERVRVK